MKLLALILLCVLIAANEAKVFERCELARLFKRHLMDGYYGYSLGDWICMAYHASQYNSRAMSSGNSGGSYDFGIFQLNSRRMCDIGRGRLSNVCNSFCVAFINDDITDDIACVKTVVSELNTMDAWVGWKNNCKGRDLSSWTHGCRV